MYLPIFIMNRVPSDIYRNQNPHLVVKKDKDGYFFVESKKAEKQVEDTQDEVPEEAKRRESKSNERFEIPEVEEYSNKNDEDKGLRLATMG